MCLVIISRAQNSPGIGLQNFSKQSDILVKDGLQEIREITATTELPFEQIEFVQLISNHIVENLWLITRRSSLHHPWVCINDARNKARKLIRGS